MKKHFISVSFVVIGLASPSSSHSQSQPARECDSQCQAKWDVVTGEYLGVIGRDPGSESIAGQAAKKFSWVLGRNWYPMTFSKESLCGSLSDYRWFVGIKLLWPFRDAENDRNVFLVPSSGTSQQLFEDAKHLFAKPGSIEKCDGEECFETEITPHGELFRNYYFPRPRNARRRMKVFPRGVDAETPLVNTRICLYGPWVFEEAHGSRPEVHPAEIAWWRDSNSGYHFAVVQDDSKRFDRKRNYKRIKGSPFDPKTWRPWSSPPRQAEFEVAFSVPRGESLTYEIAHEDVRNVVTNASGGPYTYSSGSTRVTVQIPNHGEHLDVDFKGLHWNNDSLRGYVVIRDVVGIDDRKKEGFHVFAMSEVTRGRDAPLPANPEPDESDRERVVSCAGVPGSLRTEEIDGRSTLVGDLDFRIDWEDGDHPPPDFKTEVVYMLDTKEQRQKVLDVDHLLQSSSSAWEGTVRGVPVLKGVELEFASEVTDSLYLWIPELELDAEVTTSPVTLESPGDAWPSAVALFGGETSFKPGETPAEFVRASQWLVEVHLRYVGRAPDTISPFSLMLDEALRLDQLDLADIFDSKEPLQVSWDFVMTNRTRNDVIEFNRIWEDPRIFEAPGAPAVMELATEIEGTRFRVLFPDDSLDADVYELAAHGSISDRFSDFRRVDWSVENYVLYSPDVPAVVRASLEVARDLQEFSEKTESSLNQSIDAIGTVGFDVASAEPWEEGYLKTKRLAQLLALTTYISQDRVADLRELERVATGAALLAESD